MRSQPDERVVEARLLDTQLVQDDAVARQCGDQLGDRRVRARHRDPLTVPLDRTDGRQRAELLDVHVAGGDEGDHLGLRRAGQVGRAPSSDDPSAGPVTVVDHDDAVAQPFGLFHEVRDEHDCHTGVANVLDQRPCLPSGRRVQTGGQLVEDDDLGTSDQRERNGKPLLLAAGEFGEADGRVLGQPEPGEQFAPVGGLGVEAREQRHRLGHGDLVLQLALLQLGTEHRRHRGPVVMGIPTEHPHGPAVGHPQALDAFDGGGLTRAVRPEDPEDLARFDGERDAADGVTLAVALVEVVDLDDR